MAPVAVAEWQGAGVVGPYAGSDLRTLLAGQAVLQAERPFVTWAPFSGEDRTWSYRAGANEVAAIAAGLHVRGIRPGDRVLIHLDNCPESIFAWLACGWLGAVAVTTNTRSSLDELDYFWGHSGAVAAITQPRHADLVGMACRDAAWIAVTETDGGEAPSCGRPGPAEAFAHLRGDPDDLAPHRPDPSAPFSIQYTSGTTSRPKAVLWSHANALWAAELNARHEDLRPDDVHLVSLPLFHANAQAYSVLASLWVGASCVLMPRFSASRFWATALRGRCTWASLVPFCVRALAAQEVPERHHFRLWGSTVCSPESDARFGVKTIGWWGMTETVSHGVAGSVHHANRPLSVGRPSPGYEVRLLDSTGQPVRPGETGELSIRGIRGLSLFQEYFHNPAATAAAFDDQGFLITGDRMTLESDGSLTFADRSKDMLRIGGENVAASEIERVVAETPGVAEVAVVGKPHPMLEEVAVAFVIATPEADPARLPAEILAACARKLADFKVPREVRLTASLPRSTIEKVAKVELRRWLAERSEGAS